VGAAGDEVTQTQPPKHPIADQLTHPLQSLIVLTFTAGVVLLEVQAHWEATMGAIGLFRHAANYLNIIVGIMAYVPIHYRQMVAKAMSPTTLHMQRWSE
jgi:hypothetical protein